MENFTVAIRPVTDCCAAAFRPAEDTSVICKSCHHHASVQAQAVARTAGGDKTAYAASAIEAFRKVLPAAWQASETK